MEHMEIAFLILVGASVLAFMLGNEYAKHKADNPYKDALVYQIKEGGKGRFRINLYDEKGKSMLISSGRGLKSLEDAQGVIEKLKTAEFVYTKDAFF